MQNTSKMLVRYHMGVTTLPLFVTLAYGIKDNKVGQKTRPHEHRHLLLNPSDCQGGCLLLCSTVRATDLCRAFLLMQFILLAAAKVTTTASGMRHKPINWHEHAEHTWFQARLWIYHMHKPQLACSITTCVSSHRLNLEHVSQYCQAASHEPHLPPSDYVMQPCCHNVPRQQTAASEPHRQREV